MKTTVISNKTLRFTPCHLEISYYVNLLECLGSNGGTVVYLVATKQPPGF